MRFALNMKMRFLQNLALFYLKLQLKLLLTTSVKYSLKDYRKSGILLGVPKTDIERVVDEIKVDELLHTCNTKILKTDQRKTVCQQSFNYTVPICLGNSEAGNCFAS